MTSRSSRPSTISTAVLLREALASIEAVVPQRLAEQGHAAVRTAHGPVFQHLDPDGTTVSVLAQRAGMTKQAMAELVHYLERHDYVCRAPDPHDARAKLVQLPDSGREVLTVVQELAPTMERLLLETLGRQRGQELREDLVRVQQTFDPTASSGPEARG